ncbi:efflux RND transporter periplasmic adaptor subunit [Pseudochryseolinea flava]|uniref:Efflux RND transporter periplasmic adaptor subunit n=1 Tax=Pseudochryseolinea flava TaxID=2059302 RepID=A0A364Y449_9BACT|nr:efflux RND transporter periplasmic adaptor subunit [Pseudochryseolinea flava]RAW01637.1 efflux RND transporter periplasmic adaptor subunit [Pseudochryseolinea flava]
MKRTAYNHLSVIALVALLAACAPDKKEKLKELKTKQAELNKEIVALEKEIEAENPDSADAKVKKKEVSITEVAPKPFDHYIQTQGRVEAENNVAVTAQSPGVVTQVYVKEGQQVSKGQVLAQTENSMIIQGIEAQKAQLDLATAVFQRQKNLWDQKIGTEVQFLQAKSNKEALERQIASQQQQLEMTKIKSPIAGTVDQVVAKAGEAVSPGMPAFRVVNVSDLKVVAEISEAYINQVKLGNKVIVQIPELKKDITSKVTFVGKTINSLSRTFTVEVKLDSRSEFRPNMTGVIKLVYQTAQDAITIPVSVVQEIKGEKVVYIAETNGKQTVARKKVVTVDGVFNGVAQVQGLGSGDKVITFGYQGLNDGEFIKI